MEDIFNIEERPLSFSSLKNFEVSNVDFKNYRMGQKKQTEAMMLGSAFHTLVLQPELFTQQYHILDDTAIREEIGGSRPTSTKKYKEWVDMQAGLAEGLIMLNLDQMDMLNRMRDAISDHALASDIISSCKEFEKGVQWTNKKGLNCRGFLDGFGSDVFMDLKTCQDATPYKVNNDIFKMQYHAQMAMYSEALDELFNPVSDIFIIAIDKSDNNRVSVHHFGPKVIEAGMEKYYEWCNKFETYRDYPEQYPVHFPGMNNVQLPRWMNVEDWKEVTL